jgi:uncharacterized protein involved in cysteine biosynthesis
MYTTILVLHSWLRWLALGAGLAATVDAARSKSHVSDRLGTILLSTLDLQVLLGLALYFFVSPNMAEIRAHFGESMKDPVARFWAVEHITTMFGAAIAAHVGRVLARKTADPNSRRMKLLICYGIATVLMCLAVPWPGMRAGRPLFRGF